MYYEIDRSGRDEANVDSLAAFRMPHSERPDSVDPAFAAEEEPLTSLGFQPSEWYLFHDELHSEVAYLATYLHPSGVAVARIWRRLTVGGDTAAEPTQVTFLSQFADQRFLLSTSQASDLAAAPGTVTNQLIGASTRELWESHVRKLASDPAWEPTPIRDSEQAAKVVRQYHERVRDSYLEDGIFRPLASGDAVPVAAAVGSEANPDTLADYALILAEIERLQNKRPGWGNAIWVVGVSLLVFLFAGATFWSWRLVVMLLPILLFHELGHYVAMRTFGYRNLRMFFIPLFGAAVAGQHYNVPGWKKVVVSLAGPLPGIALGVVVGILALLLGQQWLIEVSLFMLVLNGFNLLPFLPLDGGWVAHALLFSRHPALDAGFRVLAAVALIGGGLALGTRILPLIGVFMLFGVPMAFRIARVAVNIRRTGVEAVAAGDRIPPDTACRIVDALRAAIPAGMTPKQLAQTTLQVFENANARPPGWLASLGFGALHAGGFAISLLFPLSLIVAQQLGWGGRFHDLAEMPRHPLNVQQIQTVDMPAADAASRDARATVLATFPGVVDAERGFRTAEPLLPETARLKLFGQSVMLDVPETETEAAEEHAARFRWAGADTFLLTDPYTNWCTIECVAPDEQAAKEIQEMAGQYFTVSGNMHPIPPWSPDNELTPQQILARRTYGELINGPDMSQDAELERLSSLLDHAYEGSHEALMDRLEQELAAREAELIDEFRQQLRARGDQHADVALIDLYADMPQYEVTAPAGEAESLAKAEEFQRRLQAWQLEIGERLGQLPLIDSEPAAGAQRFSCTGAAHREGRQLHFDRLAFYHIYDGPQALVDWLHHRGCSEFHYGLRGFED